MPNDLKTPFDPTGYTSISGAQLEQLVAGTIPNTNRGLIYVTSDVGGVPAPPNVTTYPELASYLWLRFQPLTTSFSIYAYNTAQSYNIGYSDTSGSFITSFWNPITSGSIPSNSIQGYQIAPGTITKDKIVNIDLSQVNGYLTLLTTGTSWTGDVTGTLAGGLFLIPNAVTSTKLQSDASNDANRAVTTNSIKNGAVTLAKFDTTGLNKQILSNSADGTPAWIGPKNIIDGLANPNSGGSDDGKVVTVNSGAAGTFQYKTISVAIAGQPGSLKAMTPITGVSVNSTGGVLYDNVHNLGATPSYLRWVLVNVTPELGYTAGDEVDIANTNGNQCPPYTFGANATNVYLIANATYNSVAIAHKSTGANTLITKTSWTAKCYAGVYYP